MTYIVAILIGLGLGFYWIDKKSRDFLRENNLEENSQNLSFVKKNKIYKKNVNWSKTKIEIILLFFKKNAQSAVFRDKISKNIITVFEDKELVFYNDKYGWKYIREKEIQDIKIEGSKKDFSLAGAIVGDMVAGGIGAAVGAMGSKEMKVHVITKSFSTKDYTLIFNTSDIIDDLGNLLYKTYILSNSEIKLESKEILNLNSHEEIKGFKELLDQNIITEEEFKLKKKELLGL